MVNIVTGKINSGKSTTMLKIYEKNNKGDGFISVKRMQIDKVHGYEIMKLSSRNLKLLVVREEFFDSSSKIACQIGPYLFLEKTLKYIENEIEKMIVNKVSPIYLDEIGQLELYDQCFDKAFKMIISSETECFITVREDLVDKVIEKYNLTDVNLIQN